MNKEKSKVLIVEHSLPFYHVPVWTELTRSENIELTVVYGTGYFTGDKGVPEGNFNVDSKVRTFSGKVIRYVGGKPILWHSVALHILNKERFDVIIHQFEIKFLSLPFVFLKQKKSGGKFILWGIGQSLKKTPCLDFIRRIWAKKADAIVFYSKKNRERYRRWGIDNRKMFVAQNSLDITLIKEQLLVWDQNMIDRFKNDNNLKNSPVLLSVGRLIKRKRLDLILDAMPMLMKHFSGIKLVIIGDGQEQETLEKIVRERNLSKNVTFKGRIIGEENLAPWFLSSDLVIAPGQIGHLATQSHAYGIPLIITDNRECQGPEIDIMEPNVTGINFKHEDVDSLVKVIVNALNDSSKLEKMSINAKKRASEFSGIKKMVDGFRSSIDYVLNADEK